MDERSINASLDADLSRNMEHPIPDTQASDSIHTDATWNLENPHPTDICHRLEFNVLPDVGEPCGLPDCKKQNRLKNGMSNWSSAKYQKYINWNMENPIPSNIFL